MNRKYGRKQPAPLPAHRMLSKVSAQLPVVVDLRAWCGPIKDQGELGSCTGHAFSSKMEWIARRYRKTQPVLSPLYLYAKELIADGTFPNDEGSDGVTGCKVTIVNGCCEDALYPDTTQKIQQPTAAQDANAAQFQLGAYHGIPGSQVALSVLGDPTPWLVAMGFTVYASFESEAVAQTGVMPLPQSGEEILGGHEVLLAGYDVAPTPSLRPANCPPAVLVQNSWGADWGLKGFFWCPLAVLDMADTDLKIAHWGGPWK